MTGQELYDNLSKRDYSGSDQDQYAQFLKTLYYHLTMAGQQENFLKYLVTAESENKKIDVKDHSLEEYFMDSLVLV